MLAVVILSILHAVSAQLPEECVTPDQLGQQKCCPTLNSAVCGAPLRGYCADISSADASDVSTLWASDCITWTAFTVHAALME